jgi:hypothetical protein
MSNHQRAVGGDDNVTSISATPLDSHVVVPGAKAVVHRKKERRTEVRQLCLRADCDPGWRNDLAGILVKHHSEQKRIF